MKKLIYFLVVLCLFTACSNDVNTNTSVSNLDIDVNTEPAEKPYVDDNPIKVGLYVNGRKVSNYKTTRQNWTELGVFEVCFTDKDVLESESTKYNFKRYYQAYENIDKYKIGFQLQFDTTDGKEINETILGPDKLYIASPYMYNYLYDDVNEPDGAWYSHLETLNDNTVLSSIKLFYAEKSEAIKLPIKLTVFTYDSDDDFDEYRRYRGNSKYTVTIE